MSCVSPEEALRLDAQAAEIGCGCGPIELQLGRALAALFDGDRLAELGLSCQRDYIREHLGIPARSAYAMIRLARGTADRPMLLRAVRAGKISPRKAQLILGVEPGPASDYWTARAMQLTYVDLEDAVRSAGGAIPDEDEGETVLFGMTPAQQDRLDRAMELARLTVGLASPEWRRREAIAQEWLSSCAAWIPEDASPMAPPAAAAVAVGVDRCLHGVEEACEREQGNAPLPADPLALHHLVQRLLVAWRAHDVALGAIAWRVRETRAYRLLGFRTVEEYARERLGLSGPCFRRRVWLEGRLRELPALREARGSGRLTYSKARLVAESATAGDVDERIARAERTTCQQVERERRAEEKRSQRAHGVRRFWAPREAARTVALAVAAARAWSKAEAGVEIDAGEALALMADHFVMHHEHLWHLRKDVDWAILLRHGGCCGVPGCSRPPQHVHHIRFRSQGGSDDPRNKVALCAFHHLRGVHRYRLLVVGEAGIRLVWTFRTWFDEVLGVYVMEGDDDVTKVTESGYGYEGGRVRTRAPALAAASA